MGKNKKPRRKRVKTEAISGRLLDKISHMVHVDEKLVIYEIDNDYDKTEVRWRDTGKLRFRLTSYGPKFWCRGCNCEHLIFLTDIETIIRQMYHAHALHVALLCVNGKGVVAQPGDQFQGTVSYLCSLDFTWDELCSTHKWLEFWMPESPPLLKKLMGIPPEGMPEIPE